MKTKMQTRHVSGSLGLAAILAALLVLPVPLEAQYFGRNKVQYDDFDFRVLETDHFEIFYYPEEAEAIEDLARMSERWYERFARAFQHEFEQKKPLIIYADHPDFQQTNTLGGSIGEATGGVTESLKNRVIMPLTGSYADTDHVLGHELVHAFQYNIAQSRRGGGLQGLMTLPLWLIEGMAEYLSVGRDDPLTGMWLRDALRRDEFPTIKDLTKDQRFFPYRFGQGLWAYIGGTYGDDAVTQVFRRALRIGFQPAIGQVLGVSTDSLSAQWRRQVEQQYVPLMTGRTSPDSLGQVLLSPESDGGQQNVSPSLSPDGRYLAFLSERDLFSVDLFLADARTGEVIRKLSSANSDPHVDALRYVESSGTWSPDSRYFAYAVFARGNNELVIIDVEEGGTFRRIAPPGLGALNHPTWSPDGRTLVFTGMVGGISDLYAWDLETDRMTQLTNDKHGDFQPDFSPDGRTVAFISDRGPTTDFESLVFGPYQLTLLDMASGEIEVLPVFEDALHTNPQWGPDGETLYFISDQDGFSDIYALDLRDRSVERITRVSSGVSGITDMSPALSVADDTGELAFSVFNDGFNIHTLPAATGGETVARTVTPGAIRGRRLPPAEPNRFSRVAEYLSDPLTGLPSAGTYLTAQSRDYQPSLSLDFVGQPSVGVGNDRFGGYVGGGASAYFSDMLGNKVLGVAVQAQGSVKDIGGAVQYVDLSDRWNWGVAGQRIPYLLQGFRNGFDEDRQGAPFVGQVRQRIYVTSASGIVAYPFSTTRRVELTGGIVRYSYDLEEDRFYIGAGNQVEDIRRVGDFPDCVDTTDPNTLCTPEALNLAQASAAYVGDNSFFGFTSPVRGERFRYEVQQTVGSENYTQVIGDWRKYLQPDRNLTVAFRGLHFGRHGKSLEDNNDFSRIRGSIIQPLFLGYETFIRGYAYESFSNQECALSQLPGSTDQCPIFNRLVGHKIAVANFELRVPLLGVEQFGVINFPFLPTELVVFQDAGLAWNNLSNVDLEFTRSPGEAGRRVPVFSTGVGARFNVLGFMIFEAYYAKPWQRPDKGAHWGFQIAPGW